MESPLSQILLDEMLAPQNDLTHLVLSASGPDVLALLPGEEVTPVLDEPPHQANIRCYQKILFENESSDHIPENLFGAFHFVDSLLVSNQHENPFHLIFSQQSESKNEAKTPSIFGMEASVLCQSLQLQYLPRSQEKAKHSKCSCKKSQCLKMYCQCFRAGRECQDCDCSGCKNTQDSGHERKVAVRTAKSKDPAAFSELSYKGCRCTRSKCLKGYCECFANGHMCGKYCRCFQCSNCNRKA